MLVLQALESGIQWSGKTQLPTLICIPGSSVDNHLFQRQHPCDHSFSNGGQALEPGIQWSGETQLPTLVCIPGSSVGSPPFPKTTSLWHWSMCQIRQSLCLHFRCLSQVSNDQVKHSYLPSFAFQAHESNLHLFQRQHPCDHTFSNGGQALEPGIQQSGGAQLPTLVCIPGSWVSSFSNGGQALEPGIQWSGETQLPTLVCIPGSWVGSPPFPKTTSLWPLPSQWWRSHHCDLCQHRCHSSRWWWSRHASRQMIWGTRAPKFKFKCISWNMLLKQTVA